MLVCNNSKERAAAIAAVKNAVSLHLGLGEDDYVMVTELRCAEESCPPLETVIAVMRKDRQKQADVSGIVPLHSCDSERYGQPGSFPPPALQQIAWSELFLTCFHAAREVDAFSILPLSFPT